MHRKKKITFSVKTFAVGLFLGLAMSLIALFFIKFLFRPIDTNKKVTVTTSVVEAAKVADVAKKEETAPAAKKDNTVEIKKTDIAAKTEAPSTPVKFDGETIKVGFMGDFSGGMKDIDSPWLDGLKMRIDEACENKELKNRQIKLEALDYKGEPQVAVSSIKNFSDELGIHILLSPSGSDTLKACISIFKEKDFLVLFPVTVFDPFKELNLNTFVFAFPGNDEEAQVILNYGLNILAIRKFAIFYEDSLISRSLLKAAQPILVKRGLKENSDYIVTSYVPNTNDVKQAVDAISKFKPEALFLFSNPISTVSLLRQLDITGLKFLGTSFVEGDILYSSVKAKGLKIFVSRAVQSGLPRFSKMKLQEDYLAAAKKVQKIDSSPLFGGYLAASLFIEILKKIDGPVTKESILKQIKNDKKYNVKGCDLYLDPSLDVDLNKGFYVTDLNEKDFDLMGNVIS